MTTERAAETSTDIHALFCHYDSLYFHGSLGACVLSWSSEPHMNRYTGTIDYYPEGGCEIRLSEPLLKSCSTIALKNTLLHEMIHAFLWIINKIRDHSNHEASFRSMMNAINSSSEADHQKPFGGYNITIYHHLHKEADNNRVYHWNCDSCGASIEKTMDRDPSASVCIGHASHDESCRNPSCQLHSHNLCSGCYTKKTEPYAYEEGTTFKGDEGLHNANNEGLEYRCDDAKAIVLLDQDLAEAPERHKRARASIQKQTYFGKRRRIKSRKVYDVIIAWLGVFADEEEEEDVEPLIDRRAERRKKQQLLKSLKPSPHLMEDLMEEDIATGEGSEEGPLKIQTPESDSRTVGSALYAELSHDRKLYVSACGRDGGGPHESISSLNPDFQDDIVDISDG